ncbi:MAG: RnfABCDGE type electron transport complex subunit G [Bacteroidales bacterium]|jgi:electron transport complex protein RnfG|nr:RnfABCDGE type electron transport complex subunit G [Bacteroidales bacterium]
MAKKESTLKSMTLVLFLITAISAAALAGVYMLTKEPIQASKDNKLKETVNVVVPGADNAEIETKIIPAIDGTGDLSFYFVKKDGKTIGTAVQTFSNNGFGGTILIMVGFDENGNIIDSDVVEHHETPGLGNKSAKSVSNWNEQFKGKNPQNDNFKVNKDGGEIDAITAATISSRAYIDAIKRASDTFKNYQNSLVNNNEIKEEQNNE